jgi:hypothetical protein
MVGFWEMKGDGNEEGEGGREVWRWKRARWGGRMA